MLKQFYIRINDYLAAVATARFRKVLFENKYRDTPLFDIATIRYGKNLPKANLLDKGYPVFGGNGQIGFYSEYLYKEPQILISCRGAAAGNILVSLPQSYITSNSLVIELKDRRYFEWLKQYFLLHQLHSYTTGSAQPQITIDNLKFLSVPYPSFCNIEGLTNQSMMLSSLIRSNEIENQALSQLRDMLLPKLMSGEIDVSKVDIMQLNNHLSMQ